MAEDPQLEIKEKIKIAEEGAGSGWSPSDSGTLFAPPPAGPWGESLVRVCQLELSNPVPELLILS